MVLIDEYDHLFSLLHTKELEVMKRNKYSSLISYNIANQLFLDCKDLSTEGKIKLTLRTGVLLFKYTGTTSGDNTFSIDSLKPKYSILLGFIEKEILDTFEFYIDQFISNSKNQSIKNREDFMIKLQEWYNGYSFSPIYLQ